MINEYSSMLGFNVETTVMKLLFVISWNSSRIYGFLWIGSNNPYYLLFDDMPRLIDKYWAIIDIRKKDR